MKHYWKETDRGKTYFHNDRPVAVLEAGDGGCPRVYWRGLDLGIWDQDPAESLVEQLAAKEREIDKDNDGMKVLAAVALALIFVVCVVVASDILKKVVGETTLRMQTCVQAQHSYVEGSCVK